MRSHQTFRNLVTRPDFHPFDHEDVALVIEAGAVRADEFAGSERVAGLRSRSRATWIPNRRRDVRSPCFLSIRVTRAPRSGITTSPFL